MSSYPPYVPPPPPPPPSYGSRVAPNTIDFARCFTFVFEDPDWVKKIVMGGLFYLACFLLVGIPFVLGYAGKLCRNVIAGVARPLPDWNDLGGYFSEGLKLLIVAFVYTLPLLILYGVTIAGVVGLGTLDQNNSGFAGMIAGIGTGVSCLIFFLALAIGIFLPAALVRVAATGNVSEGFNFSGNLAFIKANLSNYLLALVVQLLANFISQFGVILFCVGVVFTGFWGLCVGAYAFADAYRLSPVK